MAIGKYELWLYHWDGTPLAYLDSMLNLEYTRAIHNVGVMNLTMPSSFDTSLLQDDYKVGVQRALPGIPKRLENMFLIQGWRKWTDRTGVDKTLIAGLDGNSILKQRVVAAQPGSSRDDKDDFAGNVAKELVRESIEVIDETYLYSPVQRDDIAPYLTVQADNDDGAEFQKDWGFRTVWDAVDSVIATSTGRGSTMWWYVVPISASEYQFRTYAGLVGQDLTSQVLISVDSGMSDVNHRYDISKERNLIWALGGPIGSGSFPEYRKWVWWRNVPRNISTPFRYSESFLDLGNEESYDEINEQTIDELQTDENLPQELLSFTLEQLEGQRYGIDWDLGDKVSVSYRGIQLEVVIKTVYIKVGNTEEIQVLFKVEVPVETD